MRRAPAILLLLLVASAFATTARWLAQASLERLSAQPALRAGLTAASAPPASTPAASNTTAGPGTTAIATPAAATQRLILVLVDGLNLRAAVQSPALERLARQGSLLTATGPDPAWALPAWATILTGASPIIHHALLPGQAQAVVPGILASARAAGLKTVVAASPGLLTLVGPEAGQAIALQPGGDVEAAIGQAMAAEAAVTLVHLDDLYPSGRTLTTRVPRERLLSLDARLDALLEPINLSQSTVVLTGTFATDPAGRHGSGDRPVPVVLAGSGIRSGVQIRADLRDLAPTLSALLAIPRPAAATGQVLAPVLSAVPPAVPAAPAPPPALAPDALAQTLTELWQQVQPFWPQLAIALVVATLYLIALARQPFAGLLFRAVLVYLVVYHAVFFAGGGSFGPELPHLGGLTQAFWQQRLVEVLVAVAVASLYLGVALGRRQIRRAGHAGVVALHAVLATLVILTLNLVPAVVWAGWAPDPSRLGLTWSIKYFMDLVQMVILGYAAMTGVLAAVAGYILAAGRTATGGSTPSGSRRRPRLAVVGDDHEPPPPRSQRPRPVRPRTSRR